MKLQQRINDIIKSGAKEDMYFEESALNFIAKYCQKIEKQKDLRLSRLLTYEQGYEHGVASGYDLGIQVCEALNEKNKKPKVRKKKIVKKIKNIEVNNANIIKRKTNNRLIS